MKKVLMTLIAAMFLSAPLLVIAAETATPVPAKVLPRSPKKKKHKLTKSEEAARAAGLNIKAANAHHGSTKGDPRKTATSTPKP